MEQVVCEICGGSMSGKPGGDSSGCQSCGMRLTAQETQKPPSGTYREKGTVTPENRGEPEAQSSLSVGKNTCTSEFYYVRQTLDSRKGTELFLKKLKDMPDIVSDIYEEIKILSADEGYYPFSVIDRRYSCSYKGTACFRKQASSTGKKARESKNTHGTYASGRIAEAKHREEIERRFVDGSFEINNSGFYSISDRLNSVFTSFSPSEYDERLSFDEYFDREFNSTRQRNYCNDAVLKKFESALCDSFGSRPVNIERIESPKGRCLQASGTSDCSDIWRNRAEKEFDTELRTAAKNKVRKLFPGDFSERVHLSLEQERCEDKTVFLPVQTVKYDYRGASFFAVLLLDKSGTVVCSYPCSNEIEAQKERNEKAVADIKEKEPVAFPLLYCLAASSAVCFLEHPPHVGASLMAVFGTAAVICNIVWIRKRKEKIRSASEDAERTLEQLKAGREDELKSGYEAFFGKSEKASPSTDGSDKNKSVRGEDFSTAVGSISGFTQKKEPDAPSP